MEPISLSNKDVPLSNKFIIDLRLEIYRPILMHILSFFDILELYKSYYIAMPYFFNDPMSLEILKERYQSKGSYDRLLSLGIIFLLLIAFGDFFGFTENLHLFLIYHR